MREIKIYTLEDEGVLNMLVKTSGGFLWKYKKN